MVVIYNEGKKDSVVRDVELNLEKENSNRFLSYVTICLESGDFITVKGSDEELKHLVTVLHEGEISCNLDDFEYLDYFENITIMEIENKSVMLDEGIEEVE